jgi:hypothetical protein
VCSQHTHALPVLVIGTRIIIVDIRDRALVNEQLKPPAGRVARVGRALFALPSDKYQIRTLHEINFTTRRPTLLIRG